MGLAGRALDLAQNGLLNDPQPVLNVVRAAYPTLDHLGPDLVVAVRESRRSEFGWDDWDRRDKPREQMSSIAPHRYPQRFAILRLLELVHSGGNPQLGGVAAGVRDFARSNAAGLLPFALRSETADGERLDRLFKLLDQAVTDEQRSEEEWLIAQPLDPGRVRDFQADVLAARCEADVLKPLFDDAGRFAFVNAPDGVMAEIGVWGTLPKGPFVPDSGWAALPGRKFAKAFERELHELLEGQLSAGREVICANLRNTEAFLKATRESVAALGAGDLVVFLAGDWLDVLADLEITVPPGWESGWMRNAERARRRAFEGELDGVPVVRLWISGAPVAYVVDIGGWGCLQLAPVGPDGVELQVSVEAMDVERVEATVATQGETADGRDRRLLQQVLLTITHRTRFVVKDASRARMLLCEAGEDDNV